MNSALLIVLIVLVALMAGVFLWQTLILYGLARSLTSVGGRLETLLAETERTLPGLLRDIQAMVTETRGKLEVTTNNLVEISGLIRDQVQRADEFVAETSDRLRLQIARAESVVSGIADRIERTTDSLQRGVLRPVQDVNALFQGVRTGLDFFLRRRPSPAPREAYRDDEMFI